MSTTLSQNRVRQILAAAAKARVLVVGDVMLDQFIWGRVARISPEAPVPVVEFERESFMPGGAGNGRDASPRRTPRAASGRRSAAFYGEPRVRTSTCKPRRPRSTSSRRFNLTPFLVYSCLCCSIPASP